MACSGARGRGRTGATRPAAGGSRKPDAGSWLVDDQDLVDGDVGQHLLRAARPRDLDPLNDFGGAQPDVQADVVATEVAGHVVDLADLASLGGLDRHRRTEAEGVALPALRPDHD